MKIYEGLEIIDLGLYIKDYKALVISDLQIGLEESLTKEGFFIPKLQFELIKKRLSSIFNKIKPDKLIINGDLKHEFGFINKQEWKETIQIIDFIAENCKEIIIIKGNHDVILEPITNKRNISLVDYYKMEHICILHGHRIVLDSLNSKILIIGHEHPAISLKEGAKIEKYKCFLKGYYDDKILIVMPSFNMLSEGSDIMKGETLSPYLAQNLFDFEVYIAEDKVYKFGKIKNLK
ncbi:metallophosphoesterase [Candidatus Woesearchaeota archaeon]|nr:metallophosphoesterase [Candidatus Woesearchaeota archaeon]